MGIAHVAIRRAPFDDFDRAGIVDPVAHFVLIRASPIRDSGRKVVEARVQKRQVHHEIHRKPFSERAAGNRSLRT